MSLKEDVVNIAQITNHLAGFAFAPHDFARVFAMNFPEIRNLEIQWCKIQQPHGFLEQVIECLDINSNPEKGAVLHMISSLINLNLTDDEIEAIASRIPSRIHIHFGQAVDEMVNFSRALITDEVENEA